MAEIGTEHANVEPAAVSDAYNGLRIKLIGKAGAWTEGFERVRHAAIEWNAAIASHQQLTIIQVAKTGVALGGDGLGIVNFPAQAVGERELRTDAPGVLGVGEFAPLMTYRLNIGRAHKPLEGSHIAEQHRSQCHATASREGSVTRIE